MKIILLGKMGAGKDTVGKYIMNNYPGFVKLAFGKGIYETAERLFPNLYHSERRREILQNIGQYMRKIDPNVWINLTLQEMKIYSHVSPYTNFIICDGRQQNELEETKKEGFISIKIYAAEKLRMERIKRRDGKKVDPATLTFETELSVDTLEADYEIHNNSEFKHLYAQVDSILDLITGGAYK